ncbi:TSUP family transporter [Devosia sp. 1566]|uniref:TSUP family transporter n=1 Tax=Devosia sp. 1566 TaxID=2499144 RepID=UPI000FD6BAB5|nr:TSUP family transporter [Devosia sp. 1566]
MDPLNVAMLLVLAGAAAYVQTLTGFAFGLLMMGGIGILGLLPLPEAAVIVSILTVVNATQVLARGWRNVAWSEFRLAIGASLLLVVLGYFMLEWLADANLDGLRLLLGAVIVGASIQLILQPHPLPNRSSSGSFVLVGALGGFLGGMFSTAGPPLIYHFYRQPLPAAAIRDTLVLIFGVNALFRLSLVGLTGSFPYEASWWALLAAPVVTATTYAAKRWPPPFAVLTLRRVAFSLLLLSGVSLAAPAIWRLGFAAAA